MNLFFIEGSLLYNTVVSVIHQHELAIEKPILLVSFQQDF